MATYTSVIFPVYVGNLSGVNYIQIGANFVWIYLHSPSRKVRVKRSKFTREELESNSNDLAFRARQVADAVL